MGGKKHCQYNYNDEGLVTNVTIEITTITTTTTTATTTPTINSKALANLLVLSVRILTLYIILLIDSILLILSSTLLHRLLYTIKNVSNGITNYFTAPRIMLILIKVY